MKKLTSSKVNALWKYQSASGDELRPFFGRTLMPSPSVASGMPSILDKAFKGEPMMAKVS